MLITLEGVYRSILLEDCEDLVAPLSAVLGTWRFAPVPSNADPAIVALRRERGTYRITSPWLDSPVTERSVAGAVFSLVAEMILAFVDERSTPLCLHAAAVERDGRLIVFPSTEKAGKSTLVSRLASFGWRIFTDDALPLSRDGAMGLALGIAPRLRLPLPAAAAPAFRTFVDAHRGPSDRESTFLALPPALLASHGETAQIGAIVLLDRKQRSRARLQPAPRGYALQQLLVQNFARAGTSLASIDALHGLTTRVPCFTLTYSNLEDATALLLTRLAAPSPQWGQELESATRNDPGRELKIPHDASRRRARQFEQAPGVILRELEGDLFLKRPGEDGVFHLNAVAAILWQLLQHSVAIATAVAILRDAFPQADPLRIKHDVKDVFNALEAGGLIQAPDRGVGPGELKGATAGTQPLADRSGLR